jgi:hypothetical protein
VMACGCSSRGKHAPKAVRELGTTTVRWGSLDDDGDKGLEECNDAQEDQHTSTEATKPLEPWNRFSRTSRAVTKAQDDRKAPMDTGEHHPKVNTHLLYRPAIRNEAFEQFFVI